MNERNRSTPCERVRARLAELVDGGLSLMEEARDLGHLEACADCGRAHADWLAFHAELGRALPRVELPAGLLEGLDRELEHVRIAAPEPRRRAGAWASLAAAAASLVALFGLEALGTAMDADRQAPLFAPVASGPGAATDGAPQLPALLPRSLYDGLFHGLDDAAGAASPALFPNLSLDPPSPEATR